MGIDRQDNLFCEIGQDLGFLSAEQVKNAMDAQKIDDAIGQKKKIGAYLFEVNALTKEQISQIVKMMDRVESNPSLPATHAAGHEASPQTSQPVPSSQQRPEKKVRIAYILLGFFLGCLGIHNFYAGYNSRAVTQLLITVLAGWFIVGIVVTAIWALIDICTVTEDAAGVPFV